MISVYDCATSANIVCVGTIEDGTDSIQVSYEEAYLHHKHGNVNVSFDRKINSYGFMYSLCAITVTCILQLTIMTDSQPLLQHVQS
jgi:hypothetical protein